MIIYKTSNLINNKIYVGKDKKDDPTYLGSGLLLNAAIEKYGSECFKKEILEICVDIAQLNSREIYWIEHLNCIAPNGYNIAKGGCGGNTRLGFTEEQYKLWLQRKSFAQSGKIGYWNGKYRPNHADAIKHAHESGQFGDYEWLRRKRLPKTVEKLGWPTGKNEQPSNVINAGKKYLNMY